MCAVSDNEPTMNAAADLLPFPWHGCVDHLIELTTGIAFNGPGVEDVMIRCRSIVGEFAGSNINVEALKNLQRAINVNVPALTIIQDCVTRWWSTYAMLERLLTLKKFIIVLHSDGQITKSLSVEDWLTVEILCDVLKPFQQLQQYFEGDKYVTLSFIPWMIGKMRNWITTVIAESMPSDDDNNENVHAAVHRLAQAMLTQFNARWGTGAEGTVFNDHVIVRGQRRIRVGIPRLSCLAAALDPRIKKLPNIPKLDADNIWKAVIEECRIEYNKLEANRNMAMGTALPAVNPNVARNRTTSSSKSIFDDLHDSQLSDDEHGVHSPAGAIRIPIIDNSQQDRE